MYIWFSIIFISNIYLLSYYRKWLLDNFDYIQDIVQMLFFAVYVNNSGECWLSVVWNMAIELVNHCQSVLWRHSKYTTFEILHILCTLVNLRWFKLLFILYTSLFVGIQTCS